MNPSCMQPFDVYLCAVYMIRYLNTNYAPHQPPWKTFRYESHEMLTVWDNVSLCLATINSGGGNPLGTPKVTSGKGSARRRHSSSSSSSSAASSASSSSKDDIDKPAHAVSASVMSRFRPVVEIFFLVHGRHALERGRAPGGGTEGKAEGLAGGDAEAGAETQASGTQASGLSSLPGSPATGLGVGMGMGMGMGVGGANRGPIPLARTLSEPVHRPSSDSWGSGTPSIGGTPSGGSQGGGSFGGSTAEGGIGGLDPASPEGRLQRLVEFIDANQRLVNAWIRNMPK